MNSFFLSGSLKMYKVITKINIFGFVTLHLKTYAELENSILRSVVKEVCVSMNVARSDATHWLCTNNVVVKVMYPISFQLVLEQVQYDWQQLQCQKSVVNLC